MTLMFKCAQYFLPITWHSGSGLVRLGNPFPDLLFSLLFKLLLLTFLFLFIRFLLLFLFAMALVRT